MIMKPECEKQGMHKEFFFGKPLGKHSFGTMKCWSIAVWSTLGKYMVMLKAESFWPGIVPSAGFSC